MLEWKDLKRENNNNNNNNNNIKAKIDYIQQNSKWGLYEDGDDMINHINSEYRKLSQKEYKTWNDSVGKVINW